MERREVLKLGSSKPWMDAMELMTGERKMDAKPILDYFQPLIQWLEEDNRRNNVTIGWKEGKLLKHTMCDFLSAKP